MLREDIQQTYEEYKFSRLRPGQVARQEFFRSVRPIRPKHGIDCLKLNDNTLLYNKTEILRALEEFYIIQFTRANCDFDLWNNFKRG